MLNGETDFSQVGFSYGYGPNGEGGNCFWEQCAQCYEYATEMVTYDIDIVHNYVTETACNYSTKMYDTEGGYYQVAYASCPGTTGFNIIPLNVPENGKVIKINFEGLAPDDPGTTLDGDGNVASTVSAYNNNNDNTEGGGVMVW